MSTVYAALPFDESIVRQHSIGARVRVTVGVRQARFGCLVAGSIRVLLYSLVFRTTFALTLVPSYHVWGVTNQELSIDTVCR